jgi:hypothetical protein
MQMAKLPPCEDEQVVIILQALADERYSHAVELIEKFIQRQSGLVVYEDVAIAGLRLELKRLEEKILELNEDKLITQQQITEFRTQYHLALGEWLQAVLDYDYRILYQKNLNKLKQQAVIKAAIAEKEAIIKNIKEKIKSLQEDALDDEAYLDELEEAFAQLKSEREALKNAQIELDQFEETLEEDDDYQEYEQAKQDKETFDEEIEEIIEQHQHDLPEEDKKRLKKAFRKACKLCHPDTVAEEFKEQAHELMVGLNMAYENQDINEIERILTLLESSGGFIASSDKIDNSLALQAKIEELSEKYQQLKQEVDELKSDETYQRIQELDDWQDYFNTIKERLQNRVAELEQEYQSLVSEEQENSKSRLQPDSKQVVSEDNYWFSDF